MPENDVSEKVLAEIVALRQEVRELTATMDDALTLLRATLNLEGEQDTTQPGYFEKLPQNPQAGEGSTENWVDLLAKRARGLGLDIPDDKARHLTTSPPTSSPTTQE
ncbi:MAG: hypothetical protein GXP41_00340 [Chloroflexi bacterium]|nr:hypothetical protein [Chloroflexota bacterium]